MLRALTLLACVWVLFPNSAHGNTNSDDVSALNVFYTSINSPGQLTSWSPSGDSLVLISFCHVLPCFISKLSGLGLNGYLGYQMDKLKSLVELDVSSNNLGGGNPLPYNLPPNLLRLNIANNQFTGGIPYSISQMTTLQYLNLAHNQLQGNLTDMFGLLVNLKTMKSSRQPANKGEVASCCGCVLEASGLRRDKLRIGTPTRQAVANNDDQESNDQTSKQRPDRQVTTRSGQIVAAYNDYDKENRR
ncbi:Protein STRUBBELIG-RECEPTOR FAMILY 7 [Platanthera guangdongensis]|uniref:Protein STRUBBELIG-RECEPTOR FAMILY 7 n=1 Tax=Platanthera guangdongensis TaxID=2320717 RepID=A0ABR2LXB3_9ASPA